MGLLERQPLLAQLRDAYAGAADRNGVLMFVAGEAGVGKTALVERFCAGLPAGTAVHRGFCDALGTPRALGPLRDIAGTGHDALGRLLATGQDRHAIFTAFLDLLRAGPSVTVIEDAHWADEATLDLLQFVGRRVGALPAMVVVTYRPEDAGRDHPLRRVLGDLATARWVRRLPVPPLTVQAVEELAGQRARTATPQLTGLTGLTGPADGWDAARLHAVTGGNPFFVTEVLGAPARDLPVTVRDAVLARVARLGPAARVVLDVVSLVPDRAEFALLEAVLGVEAEVLDDCVEAGILVVQGRTVRFRHELARRAVEAAGARRPGGRPARADPGGPYGIGHRRPGPPVVTTPTRPATRTRRCGMRRSPGGWPPDSARTGRPRRTTAGRCGTRGACRRRSRPTCGSAAPTHACVAAPSPTPSTPRRRRCTCGGRSATSGARRS